VPYSFFEELLILLDITYIFLKEGEFTFLLYKFISIAFIITVTQYSIEGETTLPVFQ